MTEHDLTNEAHRETCAECTATWAELEAISAEARALPTLTPSRDLWAGIEARIEQAERSRGAGSAQGEPRAESAARAKAARRWFATPAVRYAAAAAALIVTTATITWQVARTDTTPLVATGAPVAGTPSAGGAPGSDATPSIDDSVGDRLVRVRAAGYEQDFASLDLEISALQELLDQRRSRLDTATVAIVERNLKLIDQAIAESRAAFQRDPASQFLATQLARSYTTKLTLLRATATMPLGT